MSEQMIPLPIMIAGPALVALMVFLGQRIEEPSTLAFLVKSPTLDAVIIVVIITMLRAGYYCPQCRKNKLKEGARSSATGHYRLSWPNPDYGSRLVTFVRA
jgi:hypothetical protein